MTSARVYRVSLITVVMMLLLALPVLAFAAGPEGEISVTPGIVSAVGEKVTLKVIVTNNDGDMEFPVSLTDSNDTVFTEFGNNGEALLKNGESVSCEIPYEVTQKDLSDGGIKLLIKYTKTVNGEPENYQKSLTAPIKLDGEITELSVNRTVSTELARQGDTVIVTYELKNNGTVPMTGIKIQETIAATPMTVKSLEPGQKQVVSFSAKMGSKDLTSSAEIRYKANGTDEICTVPQQVIPCGVPNLSIHLSCKEDNVNVGEEATIIVTFENKGNISYSDITVTEDKNGEMFTGLSVAANSTVSFEKAYVMNGPSEFNVTANLHDNTGKTSTLKASAPLTVNAYDPDKTILLSLSLSSDKAQAPIFPAELVFTLEITNNSNVTAKNITVYYGSKKITTVSTLEPGKSTTVQRSVTASAAGTFAFTATCQDELKNKLTFSSNEIKIKKGKQKDTATAAPTLIAYPASPVPYAQWEEQKLAQSELQPKDNTVETLKDQEKILTYASYALAALAGAALVLLIVTVIMRIKNHAHNKNVYDSMELNALRDCKQVSDHSDNGEDDKKGIPDEEVKKRVYHDDEPNVNMEDDSLTVGAAPAGDGTGAWQIKRENTAEKPLHSSDFKPAREADTASTPLNLKRNSTNPALRAKERHAVEHKNSEEE